MEEKFNEVIQLFLEQTQKPCYVVQDAKGEPTILDDKIGGIPYLPIGEEYPKDNDGEYLALLLQINLKNIDLPGYPGKGILEIFTDKDAEWPCKYAVKYYEEELEYQKDLPAVDVSRYIVDKPFKIKYEKDISYMSTNAYNFIETISKIVSKVYDSDINNYSQLDDFFGDFDWMGKIMDATPYHSITIGGHPDFTQSDPRGNKNADMNECLFKLDSVFDLNRIALGDTGILFTLISKEDIENCNFGNALVDWDCC